VRAWWAYRLTLIFGSLAWVGVVIAVGREGLETALGQPLWATILIAPIFLAGLNGVDFRSSHEVVCRLEVELLAQPYRPPNAPVWGRYALRASREGASRHSATAVMICETRAPLAP
jgi:hypothetical protein